MKHAITLAAAILALLLLHLFVVPNGDLLSSDRIWSEKTGSSEWSTVISSSTNEYHSWRVPFFFSPLASGNPQYSSVASSVTLSCLGFYLLSGAISLGAGSAILLGLLFSTLVLVAFGVDPVIFQSISTLPLLSWWAIDARERAGSRQGKLLLLLTLLLTATAHQLALPLLLVILLLNLSERHQDQRARFSSAFIVAAVAITFCAGLFSPTPEMPDYPNLSRVVSDDGIPGRFQPAIGESPPITIVDRNAVKSSFKFSSLFLALLALVLFRTNHLSSKTSLRLVAVVVSLSLFVDIWLPEPLAQIGPIQALRRISPGTFFFALTPIFLCSAIFFNLLILASIRKALITLLAALIIGSISGDVRSPAILEHTPLAVSSTSIKFMELLKTGELEIPRKILLSPSLAVLKKLGSLPDSAAGERLKRKRKRITLESEYSPDHLRKMLDHNENTRWSPLKGRQDGGEYFRIRLAEPVAVIGLKLDPGRFMADFARGLELRLCNKTSPALFEQNPWEGAVNFTSDGFPYFGSQSDTSVKFRAAVTTDCLEVYQTASSKHFDWSVAELEILVRPAEQQE